MNTVPRFRFVAMPVPSIPPELARRLVWEAAAVQALFPGRCRLAFEPDGRPAWHARVPAEGRTFPVIVTYPAAYPAAPPRLETTLPLPGGCPHVLGRQGGRTTLCWLAGHTGHPRRRWDPARHTAATALRAAQRWALAFLVWQALGTWPVRDAWELREGTLR
jgi:hypothetical protein